MAKQTPAQQAAAAAYAATPTPGSINRQYQQSENNVMGFGTALAQLLHSMPGAGAGYADAIQRQSGIDSAAQNALAATGTPYAAGSGAAVAGMGSSALSALNANAAAANSYSAKQPGIAAGRAQYGVQSLETGRQNALQQRGDEYRQAYTSALAQARQQAEAIREFNQNMGLQNRQLNAQIAQNQADTRYRYAALAQNQNQFRSSQAQQFQEYMLGLRQKVASGSAPGLQGFTPNEIASLQRRGSDYIQNTAVIHGLRIQTAIRNLMAQGIPRSIAIYEAQEGYATMTAPRQAEFKGTDSQGNRTYNGLGYQQALQAYHAALGSFRKWVNQRQYQRTLSQQKGQGTNPGNRRTQEGRSS